MAIFKTANGKGKYYDAESKEQVLKYVLNPYKMTHGYYGAYGVDTCDIVGSMNEVSKRFGKTEGVQLRHFILSFDDREVLSFKVVNEIAMKIAYRLGKEFQLIYAVHETQEHPHIHFVMNSVSYVDGHRYYGTKKEHHAMMDSIRRVLREYCIKELKYVSNS